MNSPAVAGLEVGMLAYFDILCKILWILTYHHIIPHVHGTDINCHLRNISPCAKIQQPRIVQAAAHEKQKVGTRQRTPPA